MQYPRTTHNGVSGGFVHVVPTTHFVLEERNVVTHFQANLSLRQKTGIPLYSVGLTVLDKILTNGVSSGIHPEIVILDR